MYNEKVIMLADVNKDIGTIISQAKERAEADLQAKIEMSKRSDVDVREIFSAEEFDAICQQNEFFAGKLADMSKVQRHKKLTLAASWLNESSFEVVAVEIEPVSQERPNAIVSMEIRRLASLKAQELQAFTAMTALADTVFMSGVKDSTIRFTFGIEGVWHE